MKTIGELFYRGGPGFMGLLTILLVVMVAWIVYHFVVAYSGKKMSIEKALRKIGYGRSIGLFALVTGFLGQLVGLTMAMNVISKMGGVSPGILAEGIGVTMICVIYGIFIYLFSLLLWFIASNILERKLK
ncbi:MAG: MotA/TolQ/ExbB proton channel family protein [Bacteroidales bacterium]|nr:MotA/TolQ/ExbB proton channel family protein [Bacteroidales bacterium]